MFNQLLRVWVTYYVAQQSYKLVIALKETVTWARKRSQIFFNMYYEKIKFLMSRHTAGNSWKQSIIISHSIMQCNITYSLVRKTIRNCIFADLKFTGKLILGIIKCCDDWFSVMVQVYKAMKRIHSILILCSLFSGKSFYLQLINKWSFLFQISACKNLF